MNKDKILLIVFCVSLPLLLLLFSYKVVLGTSNLTDAQQEWIDFFDGNELPDNYTSLEVSHMQDVKGVMGGGDIAFYALLVITTLIITRYKKEWKITRKLLRYGGRTTVVLLLGLLLFSVVAFNYLFSLFHAILFPQGNWMFPTDSLLIQTFPLDFFINTSTTIFSLTLLFGIVFIVVGKYIKR